MLLYKNKSFLVPYLFIGSYILSCTYIIANNSEAFIPITLISSLLCVAFTYSFYIKEHNKFYQFLLFVLPLSLNVYVGSTGTSILLPSEAVIATLGIAFCIYIVTHFDFDKEFLVHPITFFTFLYLLSLWMSTIFSTMPIVSLKTSILKSLYILIFYFLSAMYIKRSKRFIVSSFLLYATSLFIVIAITLYKHSAFLFSKGRANMIPQPFFSDHTIYSTCVAMILPFILFTLFQENNNLWKRIIYICAGLACTIAIIFAYSRATWLSVLIALLFVCMLYLRFKFTHIILLLSTIIAVLFLNKDNILDELKHNKNVSNAKHSTIETQVKSIGNIQSDQSNAERINRWKCAVRMFNDRPLCGFGPGTYQFQYLSYQRQEDMTRISVKSPYNIQFGKGGSAHSEYFLALSECGIIGFIAFIGLLLSAIYSGITIFNTTTVKKVRNTAVVLLSALIIYFTHTLFNNFLEIDKAAFLFWGALSGLACLEVYHRKGKES